MQIKLRLHLLSLWPFVLHIESGNKSLIEFMEHKSQKNLGADSVTSLRFSATSVSRWLPFVWHACSSNRCVLGSARRCQDRASKGWVPFDEVISQTRDDRENIRLCVCVCECESFGKKRAIAPGNTRTVLLINIHSKCTVSPKPQIRHQTQRLLPPPASAYRGGVGGRRSPSAADGCHPSDTAEYEYGCGIFDCCYINMWKSTALVTANWEDSRASYSGAEAGRRWCQIKSITAD